MAVSLTEPMAMADPMAEPEAEPVAYSTISMITMAEPEAEPLANSSLSAEDLSAMAPMEDLLPTLLQIFLTVRICENILRFVRICENILRFRNQI